MVAIVTGTVPASEFVLRHTLSTLPDVEIECERLVRSGEMSALPLLRVRYADREEVDAAFATDPTVEEVSCLAEFDEECLFRMQWVGHVDLLMQMLTNGQATVLDACGRDSRWRFRVLYPDREHLSRTHEFAEEHGLTFEVATVREMEVGSVGWFGLTEKQNEALVLAARQGYFEVPRRRSLAELAEELGMTHQALSELLRRGLGSLTEDALFVDAFPDEEEGVFGKGMS